MSTFFPEAERHATYKHPGILYAVAVDSVRKRLYAGSFDHGLYVFDLESEKKEPAARWTGHANYVSALTSFARDGQGDGPPHLVSGSYDRRLIWWDTESGQAKFSVDAHEGWIRSVVAFPDGERLVSVGDDMRVKIWEAGTGKLIHSLEGHARTTPQGHVNALYTVGVSPDGESIASADRMGEVRVWESGGGELAQTFRVPTLYTYDPRQRKRSIGGIRAVAFSRDGLLAASGVGQVGNVDGFSGPSHLELWNWRKPERIVATGASGHKGILQDLAFHPSGVWLCAAGGGPDDGVIAFWDVSELKKARQISDADEKKDKKDKSKIAVTAHRVKTGGHIQKMCMNEDGTEIYTAGYQKLEVWRLGKYSAF